MNGARKRVVSRPRRWVETWRTIVGTGYQFSVSKQTYANEMENRRASRHYPASLGELQAWFRTGADCLGYLEWLRWPNGVLCPECGAKGTWRVRGVRFTCCACAAQVCAEARGQ